MSAEEKICTISGMRPHKLPHDLNLSKLLSKLEDEIRKCIYLGYKTFQTGMAMGVDIWAAEIVLKCRENFPTIRLVCYLPCETQADKWINAWREKYFNILAEADEVIYLQKHYSTGCMQRRNRVMLDDSSCLIAVHDEISTGGTAHTIHYAKTRGLDVVIINPYNYITGKQTPK